MRGIESNRLVRLLARAVGGLGMLLVAVCLSSATSRPAAAQAPASEQREAALEPYVEAIPGSLVEFNMVPVPAGSVMVDTPEGPQRTYVEAFWIGETEVTWDAYDIFVYGLDDKEETNSVDAVSRPSKPYVLPGEDFGHQGYPALAMTRKAAADYSRWLSAKTGNTYRLPTEAEWLRACRAGRVEESASGEEALDDYAWYRGNANKKTHPVDSLAPNRLGVYDMRGNVAEWVVADSVEGDLPAVVRGGAFTSEASDVGCGARMTQIPAWNATDPQLPKSQWWLSDAPFVGFRVAREPPDSAR